MSMSPIQSPHQPFDLSINNNLHDHKQALNCSSLAKKVGDVVYEILGYTPVIGTLIGAHHLYKAVTEGKGDGWETFQIIVQITSFLVVPQIIYGIACAVYAIGHICLEEPGLDPDLDKRGLQYSLNLQSSKT